jgi:hypothetical protein
VPYFRHKGLNATKINIVQQIDAFALNRFDDKSRDIAHRQGFGLIDKAADFRDVPFPRGELGPRLQGCNAGHATFRLRRGDILRKRPA